MLVRGAVPGDAEAIATVHVRSWQGAYPHVFPAEALARLDASRRAAYWRGRIVAGDTVLVTEEVTGFASVGPSRDPDAEGLGELYAIYVTPEHWDTGAGRGLMDAAVEALREAGFAEAVLWVLEDNPRARRFYERAGWTVDGAVKEDEFLGTRVREVRYRISLR
jgi:GNAT superfamily N-acetyltransferase